MRQERDEVWQAWRRALAAGLLCATLPAAAGDDELFILANMQFTVLHEVGHVLLTEVDLPFLGGEEQASDQLAAASLLLSSGPRHDPQAPSKLLAAAHGWLIEWALHEADGNRFDYWDSHPLDLQRYYNLLCLLQGGAAGGLPSMDDQLSLPYPRAWRCDDEYRRVRSGLQWISRSRGAATPVQRLGKARVGVIYEWPDNVEHEPLHRLVRESGVLEQTARIIETHFALPQRISIVLANICGETAYWRADLREIVVCYALVERFVRLARLRPCLTPRRGLEPARAPEEAEIAQCVRERRAAAPQAAAVRAAAGDALR